VESGKIEDYIIHKPVTYRSDLVTVLHKFIVHFDDLFAPETAFSSSEKIAKIFGWPF
jgi:hypothetical protein